MPSGNHEPRNATSRVAITAASFVAVLCMTFAGLSEAEACSSSPPPPDCGVSLSCSLTMPTTLAANANPSGEMPALLYLTITGNDPRCPEQGQVRVDLDAECFTVDENGDEVETGGGSGDWTGTVQQGQKTPVNVDLGFIPGPERTCQASGTARVTLRSGQSATATCKDQQVCLVPPTSSGEPLVDLRLKDPQDAVALVPPGSPQRTVYEIVNNSNQTFTGNLTVKMDNANEAPSAGLLPAPDPDPAVVCSGSSPDVPDPPLDCTDTDANPGANSGAVCGCDKKMYDNECVLANAGVTKLADGQCPPEYAAAQGYNISDPGEGDDFPSDIVMEDENINECLPLPTNPSTYTESQAERKIEQLGPGETIEFSVVSRNWHLCKDGSCSQATAQLSGALLTDGTLISACGGGTVLVDTEETVQSNPCDDGSSGTPDTDPYDPDDSDGDGISDDEEIANGTDPNNSDTDGDGLSDSEEILTGTDPNVGDTDGDGLSDGEEITQTGTDPNETDTDDDGLTDGEEVNTHGTNPNSGDTDQDGLGDSYEVDNSLDPTDPDMDDDGLSDGDEDALCTDITNPDTDGDGSLDGVESRCPTSDPCVADSAADICLDSDGDGLSDTEEATYGTDPNSADSDGDGLSDGQEVFIYGTDPNAEDTDGDGLTDGDEVNTYGTNPNSGDTDGDGLSDSDELNNHGTDPTRTDTDGDGLSDSAELTQYNTDPTSRDTDQGGAPDGHEVENGYDPLDPSDDDYFTSTLNSGAGIVLRGPSSDTDTVIYLTETDINQDVDRVMSRAKNLTDKVGRIDSQVMFVNPTSNGDNLDVTVTLDTFLEQDSSPYSVERLQIGPKSMHPEHDGRDIIGMGEIEINSEPYTLFEIMYQGSVWTQNPQTGDSSRLEITDFDFRVEDKAIVVDLSFDAPDFDTDQYWLMHDINAYLRTSVETVCDDGMDDDNDGKIDCEDSNCSTYPTCLNGGGDTGGGDGDTGVQPDAGNGEDNDGEDGNSSYLDGDGGCSCSSVDDRSSGPFGSLAIMLLGLLSLRWFRRRE